MNLPAFSNTADGQPRKHLEPKNSRLTCPHGLWWHLSCKECDANLDRVAAQLNCPVFYCKDRNHTHLSLKSAVLCIEEMDAASARERLEEFQNSVKCLRCRDTGVYGLMGDIICDCTTEGLRRREGIDTPPEGTDALDAEIARDCAKDGIDYYATLRSGQGLKGGQGRDCSPAMAILVLVACLSLVAFVVIVLLSHPI